MKKLFTFAAAVLASVAMMATDKTPSSTLDISEVTAENWGTWLNGTTPVIDANGFHITGYMGRQSNQQTWIGFQGGNTGGSQGTPWNAPDDAEYALGSLAYGNDGRFMTMRTNRTMYFRVTGCTEAHALVQAQSNGTRGVAIAAYEYTSARAAEAFASDVTEKTNNEMEEIGVTGLDPVKTYEILLSGTSGDNGNFLEICFVANSVPVPTYDVTYYANNSSNAVEIAENAKKVAANMFDADEGYKFVGWNTAADGSGDDYEIGDVLESDLTLYAQWEAVCYKVIYDLVAGIGSAAVTADNATVSDDPLALIMSNTSGRITLTPLAGYEFKAGDIIEFSGTVGNAGKPFGIKIGSQTIEAAEVIPNNPEDLTEGGTASASGILAADGATIAIGRDGGTTTTLLTCVIKQEVECGGETTAIDNTKAEVKAVKRVINGQLFIEKAGVLYNAQGAVVK